MRVSHLVFLAACAVAAPVEERAFSPSVTIQNGTVVGKTSVVAINDGTYFASIDTFNGIPFALPPVGPLRLRVPQSYNTSYGTLTATSEPAACPQSTTPANSSGSDMQNNPFFQAPNKTSEDCLTLNIQRLSSATSTSKWPVVVWIYGGGFKSGSTQLYDAGQIIAKSKQLNSPVIYVAMNYRLGGFGFLPGKDLMKEGNTNLGLRDQRKALEWVQENIAAFGGDPDRVTIWGESAGSISVFDHTIINGGDNTYKGKPLFKAALMNSGSVIPTRNVDSPKAQAAYNAVIKAAKCDTAPNPLTCLRGLSLDAFSNATSVISADPLNLNLVYCPRPDTNNAFFPLSPEVAVGQGKFTKLPIIVGDNEDEGTIFAKPLTNLSTSADVKTYLNGFFPGTNTNVVSALVDAYPDDPAAGSPFDTGNANNNAYPEYKRVAALLGDLVFTLTRRAYLTNVSAEVTSWSYINSYLHGTPTYGTYHAADVLNIYFGLTGGFKNVRFPTLTYYISFFNYGDPNAITADGNTPQLAWPKWTTASPQLLNFTTAPVLGMDTFRQTQYAQIKKSLKVLQI